MSVDTEGKKTEGWVQQLGREEKSNRELQESRVRKGSKEKWSSLKTDSVSGGRTLSTKPRGTSKFRKITERGPLDPSALFWQPWQTPRLGHLVAAGNVFGTSGRQGVQLSLALSQPELHLCSFSQFLLLQLLPLTVLPICNKALCLHGIWVHWQLQNTLYAWRFSGSKWWISSDLQVPALQTVLPFFSPYISFQVHLLWPKWYNYFMWLMFHYSVKVRG